MSKRIDPSEQTVYSTIAKDGTVRWALYPMHTAPRKYESIPGPKRKNWTFRVLWSTDYYDEHMSGSCRGKDGFVLAGNRFDFGFDYCNQAIISWLMDDNDGEDENEAD